MDRHALLKRLARTFGLAQMLSGGLLCGVAVNDALAATGVAQETATLQAAYYAAMFSLGGWMFFWSRKP